MARSTRKPDCCDYDARRRKRSQHLSSTIERLARAGEQAGFSVEEMIEMLNAGVSIGALLDMISYSLSHEALEFKQQRPSAGRLQERAGGNTHVLLGVQESGRSF